MARSWHYPRWRRIVMQVTLWLILGASVGLAALVSHQHPAPSATTLPRRVSAGPITLRLPLGWAVTASSADGTANDGTSSDGDSAAADPSQSVLIAQCTEDDQMQSWQLIVRLLPAARGAAPQSVLRRSGLLRGSFTQGDTGSADDADTPAVPKAIAIGRSSGILVKVLQVRAAGDDGEPRIARQELFGCAVLPEGRAIVLQLDCPQNADEGGQATRLLQSIAATVKVAAPTAATEPVEQI